MMRKVSAFSTALCLGLLLAGCGELPEKAVVGLTAPDFTLVDRQGRTWSLSSLRGQVVLVNFWATWCPPCLQEMPSMENLYRSMPRGGFTMLAVLYKDEPSSADQLAAKQGYTFPILVDPESATGQAYGLTGVPETFIVDKAGVLREKFIGPVQWDSPPSREMLMKYIAR